MGKKDAVTTVEVHSQEEACLLDALKRQDDQTLSLNDVRRAMRALPHLGTLSDAAFRKRVQRILERLENAPPLIERLDGQGEPLLYDAQGKTRAVRLIGSRDPLMQMTRSLQSKGAGHSAVAVMLALAERSLKRQLPQKYLDWLEPLFRYAEEEVVRISEEGSGPARVSWDARALVNSIYVAQKGIVQLPGPEVADAMTGPDRLLERLYDAIGRNKRVTFSYTGKRRKGERCYVCGPIGIVFRAPKVYLVGEDLGETEAGYIRVWSLHRIAALDVGQLNYLPPTDFDLAAYVESEANLESVWDPERAQPVRISFNVKPVPIPGHGSGLVTDEFEEMRLEGHESLTRHKDGSITIRLCRKDTVDFRRWLLGYGSAIADVRGLIDWSQ